MADQPCPTCGRCPWPCEACEAAEARTKVRAHYLRHHCDETKGFDSPEDAQAFLWNGEGDLALSSCCVIWPDGRRHAYDFVKDELGEEWLPPHPEQDEWRT